MDDVDLYTGALSEKPLEDSLLGPTFTCLILDQFVRLKKGDRFWYENPHQPQRFTKEQLKEIRKTKLANIICDNSDDIRLTQPYLMKKVGDGNKTVKCSDLPKVNLKHWKEENETLSRVSFVEEAIGVKILHLRT